MKKLLSLLCICGFILSVGSVYALDTPKLKPKPTPTPPPQPKPLTNENQPIDYYQMKDASMLEGLLYDNPDTLAKLEGYSDIIIEGRPTGETEQVLVRFSDGVSVLSGYTLNTIIIDKVYRGDVRAGDKIKIAEAYYIADDTVYHSGLYYPSEIDKPYVWLLTDMRPTFENYSLVLWERGRYPVIDQDARSAEQLDALSRKDLNLSPSGEQTEETVYRNILKEVVAKYMK